MTAFYANLQYSIYKYFEFVHNESNTNYLQFQWNIKQINKYFFIQLFFINDS